MAYTLEQVDKAFKTLPPAVVQAMTIVNVGGKIGEIGKKFSLHVDSLGILNNEVLLAIIGVSKPESFLTNITQRMSVSRDMALEITKQVNETIFTPIRQKVIQIKEATEPEKTERKEALKPQDAPEIDHTEMSVLKNSGIELDSGASDSSIGASPKEKRTELIDEIENPPRSESIHFSASTPSVDDMPVPKPPARPTVALGGIVAQKLSSSSSPLSKTVPPAQAKPEQPKQPAPIPVQKSSDPYREQVM